MKRKQYFFEGDLLRTIWCPCVAFLNLSRISTIEKSHKLLKEKNVRILGNDKPVIGSHNKPILFLHPKDFCGTLIELEEK